MRLAPPKRIAEIIYLPDSSELNVMLNRYMKRDKYMKLDAIICNDSLSVARNRVTNRLRNHGYYYSVRSISRFLPTRFKCRARWW